MKFGNVLITTIARCLFQLCEACLILKQAGSYETRTTWWRNLGIMECGRKHWKNSVPIPNSPKKPEMVGQPHVGNMFRQPLSQTSCIVMWHRVHSPGFGKLQACLLSSFYKSFPLHVSTKENLTKEAVRWFGRQRWLWPSGMMTRAQFLGLTCERRAMTPMTSHGVLGPPCFHRSAHMPPLLRMIW